MAESTCVNDAAIAVTRKLIDEGKLVEAGFAIFANYLLPSDLPPELLVITRLAFIAGAEHVWSSTMGMLDHSTGPLDDDLRRMAMIQREIDGWRAVLSNRLDPPQGSA